MDITIPDSVAKWLADLIEKVAYDGGRDAALDVLLVEVASDIRAKLPTGEGTGQ